MFPDLLGARDKNNILVPFISFYSISISFLRSISTMEDNAATGSNTTTAPSVFEEDVLTEEELDWWKAMFVHRIIIVKVVGLLSAMGSAYIIYKLAIDAKDAADRRKKLNRSFDRLLLGLCISDFISSLSFFFASW